MKCIRWINNLLEIIRWMRRHVECLAPNYVKANLDLELTRVSQPASQGDAERMNYAAASLIKRQIFSEGRTRVVVRGVRHVLPKSWGRYMRAKEVKR